MRGNQLLYIKARLGARFNLPRFEKRHFPDGKILCL
jgi:hypothetical protein